MSSLAKNNFYQFLEHKMNETKWTRQSEHIAQEKL